MGFSLDELNQYLEANKDGQVDSNKVVAPDAAAAAAAAASAASAASAAPGSSVLSEEEKESMAAEVLLKKVGVSSFDEIRQLKDRADQLMLENKAYLHSFNQFAEAGEDPTVLAISGLMKHGVKNPAAIASVLDVMNGEHKSTKDLLKAFTTILVPESASDPEALEQSIIQEYDIDPNTGEPANLARAAGAVSQAKAKIEELRGKIRVDESTSVKSLFEKHKAQHQQLAESWRGASSHMVNGMPETVDITDKNGIKVPVPVNKDAMSRVAASVASLFTHAGIPVNEQVSQMASSMVTDRLIATKLPDILENYYAIRKAEEEKRQANFKTTDANAGQGGGGDSSYEELKTKLGINS